MLLPGQGNFLSWTPRKVDRIEARTGTAVARWLRPRATDEVRFAGVRVRVRVVRVGAIALDPDGAVAVVRGGPAPVLAIGGGGLVRGLAQAILGGPDELAAARPPTVAEQAVWGLAVAAVIDAVARDGALAVEPSRIAPAMVAGAAMVELAVDALSASTDRDTGAVVRGPAWIAVPAAVLDRPPPGLPLAALADRAGWLEEVSVDAPVVIAQAAVTLAELAGLQPRDAIIVGAIGEPGAGSLRVGRGELAVTIAGEPGADRVTVRGRYQRGRMDETLGDDLTVELAVSAGTVEVSARKLLELAPGEVLALGRPAGGEVELVVGRRVFGKGELIDVDGELAVRVLSVNPR
jgi:hypothetical protein